MASVPPLTGVVDADLKRITAAITRIGADLSGARAVADGGQEGPAELGDETVVRPGGVPPAARPAQ